MTRWILGGAALLVLLAGGWLAVRPGLSVEVTRPTRGPAVQAVYATGTVEATVMLPIAPRTGARLMALNVDEGSHVTKDQVLARLEDDDLRHTLQELRTREMWAKDEFERRDRLLAKHAVTREARDQARVEWDAAKSAADRAEAQADYMKLLAPADGTIIRRDGEIGQLIPANQPVFWLSCCAPLRISAEVDEEDIAKVQPGQKALIRADAFPGKVFHGTVQGITPKGDPVARSYRVRIGFSEETPLLIGMTAETNILLHERDNALLIPSEALTKNNTVWLVKGGKLVEQPVSVGAKGPQQVEIVSGVDETDDVVRKPDATLTAGQRVREAR